MAVKIRLQRKGKKRKPFYHIVIADSRSPRDGRFIEKIGTYNPMTVPATIELELVNHAADCLVLALDDETFQNAGQTTPNTSETWEPNSSCSRVRCL